MRRHRCFSHRRSTHPYTIRKLRACLPAYLSATQPTGRSAHSGRQECYSTTNVCRYQKYIRCRKPLTEGRSGRSIGRSVYSRTIHPPTCPPVCLSIDVSVRLSVCPSLLRGQTNSGADIISFLFQKASTPVDVGVGGSVDVGMSSPLQASPLVVV